MNAYQTTSTPSQTNAEVARLQDEVAGLKDEVARLQEKIRAEATGGLHLLDEILMHRVAEDSTLPTKTVLDIAGHFYRVSGMAAKQEQAEQASRFNLVIKLRGQDIAVEAAASGGTLSTPIDVVPDRLEDEGVIDTEEPPYTVVDSLAHKPDYLLAATEPRVGNLLDFSSLDFNDE